MKLYNTEIENWSNIVDFEEIRDNWSEGEEYGTWFTTSQSEFDWWNQLANAIEYLNDNGIDADVNELADYIAIAKEEGFEG